MNQHARHKPLNERQELVMRLKDEEKLDWDEIARQIGKGVEWTRLIYADARRRLDDFTQHGGDSLLLLPKRARKLAEFYGIKNRAEIRAAIESGRLEWHSKWKVLSFPKNRPRNCSWKTWAALNEWAGLPSPGPAEKG